MTLCDEYLGMEVVERDIDRSEFAAAQEAFFCGTAWEVTPLVSVDRLAVGDGQGRTRGAPAPGGVLRDRHRRAPRPRRVAHAGVRLNGGWTHEPTAIWSNESRGRSRRPGSSTRSSPAIRSSPTPRCSANDTATRPTLSANTILVKAKTGGVRYVVCVVLASTRLDVNRTVRKRLGARRVSFASADETRAATGMEIGGVTPLALPEASSKSGSTPASWPASG